MARLRAVVVVVVVLVLGAWSCQVPTDSPGSAGSADVPVTTTGLTALVAGEDWHYVGEAGEPAFSSWWTNGTSGWPSFAFRLREVGVVDVVGVISTSSTPSTNAFGNHPVFTLPEGYRPATDQVAFMTYTRNNGSGYSTRIAIVRDNGSFELAPSLSAGDVVYISGSHFITQPDVIP